MLSPHSRRVFLAYGTQFIGALPTLMSSSLLADEMPEFGQDADFIHLRRQDRAVLAILMPIALGVELNHELPADQELLLQALKAFDLVVGCLSDANRDMYELLMSILANPVTRMMLGLWPSWQKASRAEVLDFLNHWERSVIELKRYGYQSLLQLLMVAFYSVRGNTAAIHYPDVPDSIRPFLRRFSEEH